MRLIKWFSTKFIGLNFEFKRNQRFKKTRPIHLQVKCIKI